MGRTRTQYDVLGVPEDATVEEIRHAYRVLVRRHHPDHLGEGGNDPRARAEAEARIRELTAAWQELRDPGRRAAYDRRRGSISSATPYSPFPPGTDPAPRGGYDEWYADAADRRAAARVVRRPTGPAKPFRVRLLIGFGLVILVGIMLIVLVTGSGDGTSPPAVDRGSCVRVAADAPATEVPCDEPNDGEVLTQVAVPGACPNGAIARRLAPGDAEVTCLATAVP